MRRTILQSLYRLFPFDIVGDCRLSPPKEQIRISCIINFYGRLDLLGGILHSLAGQCYDRSLFEVILVEDRGGSEEGRSLAEDFASVLQTVYLPLDKNFGMMGYSRNYGLTRSRGEIILFLDDDTVILQTDFLTRLDAVFIANPSVDAVVPHGNASFSMIADRYDFHDDYFMTSRCTAHRRTVLAELGGFIDNFVGQEDVEFVARFTIAGKRSFNCDKLNYFHPPLLVPNFRKPKAVGYSFYLLKTRYPVIIWLLLLLNCSRHAPLYLLPVKRYREMGRFGLGFIAGIILSIFKKEGFRYS